MRDQYAGDVSDVLKIALPRALAGTDRAADIAWCYAPSDDERADGRHLENWDKPAWQQLDAQLHGGLSRLPERSIAALESTPIWPKGSPLWVWRRRCQVEVLSATLSRAMCRVIGFLESFRLGSQPISIRQNFR